MSEAVVEHAAERSDALARIDQLRGRIQALEGGPTRLTVPTLPMFDGLVQLRTGGSYAVDSAPLAMALADSRISQTPAPVQAVLYALLGIAWIFPLMPLISWMGKNDATNDATNDAGDRG